MTESPARSRFGTFINVMFGHDGRIGRLYFWLGMTATTAITVFFGANAEGATMGTGELGRYLAFFFIVGLLVWMHSAVIVKRLHDRNRGGLWYFAYGIAPLGFFLWAVYLHASGELTGASLFYILSAIGIAWLVIELGLMRGTVGPNRFGPDPGDP